MHESDVYQCTLGCFGCLLTHKMSIEDMYTCQVEDFGWRDEHSVTECNELIVCNVVNDSVPPFWSHCTGERNHFLKQQHCD